MTTLEKSSLRATSLEKGTEAPLQKLPPEITSMFFLHMDLPTFHTAILVCRQLYAAFKCQEGQILVNFFNAMVPMGVQDHALFAHECPLVPLLNFDAVKEFIDKYLIRGEIRLGYTNGEIISMIKVAKAVKTLTQAFVDFCTYANSDLHALLVQSQGLTLSERDRIYRAFYSFEIFRRLLQPLSAMESPSDALTEYVEEVGEAFMDQFSPYENVQLACIHDFLERYVLPYFKDMASHDVEWGQACVPWGLEVRNKRVQMILSLGLERIVQFVEAKSHKERALTVPEPPQEHRYFIQKALDLRTVSQHAQQPNHYKIPDFFKETDNGPLNAMAWSQMYGPYPKLPIYGANDHDKRRWGYLMWDMFRIRGLRLIDSTLRYYPAVRPDQAQTEDQPQEEMEKSWTERARLYERGARGWWDVDNESHLMYEKP